MKYYNKIEIVSANMITDWVAWIRNLLGLKLISYSEMIEQETNKMMEAMPPMEWFRVDIDEVGGGFMINVYGVQKWVRQ